MPQNRKVKMPSVGDIVQSTQGRDRFRVFLVTEVGSGVAPIVVADGKKHPTAEKKHKNPRHLRVVKRCCEIDEKLDFASLTDVQVYEICKKYDYLQKTC